MGVEKLIEEANSLANQGRFSEAEAAFVKILQLVPNRYEALVGLGKICRVYEQPQKAIEYFQKGLVSNPGGVEALVGLWNEKRKICDWEGYEKLAEQVDRRVKKLYMLGEAPGEIPFENITRSAKLGFNLEIAKWWTEQYVAKRIEKLKQVCNFVFGRENRVKIRLGYLSGEIREHPVTRLISDVFGLHDREQFEIIMFSFGKDDGSKLRKKVEKEVDKFVDMEGWGVERMARKIYEEKIDVLIDLSGYSGVSKPEVVALRPAPIIVSYLGYPGTSGGLHDYLITDKTLTPRNEENWYSEKFIYMPKDYQILSKVRAGKRIRREEVGLPKEAVVLASFNKPYKIEPAVFSTWMEVLRRLPGTVLWLYADSKLTKENLLEEAVKRGINKRRIVFAQNCSYPDHLARLRLADIALDTHIYNGGATTSDALRMGVPVVTLRGGHYLSRMSESLLRTVGLEELIADGLGQYLATIEGLAGDKKKLREKKQKLKQGVGLRRLMDTKQFVQGLEAGLRIAYERFLNGRGVDHVVV